MDLRGIGAYQIIYLSTERTLNVLDVSFNKIGKSDGSSFMGDFDDEINLSFKGLNFITKGLCSGKMYLMNFSHNFISAIDDSALLQVTELRIIDLSFNLIEYLNTNVFRKVCSTLQEIYLQDNGFKRFFHSETPLIYLFLLDLTRNRIENYNYIWTTSFCWYLQTLNSSFNNVSSIVINCSTAFKMKTLNVSYNQLQTIDYINFIDSPMETLNISCSKYLKGNELTELNTVTFTTIPKLNSIGISKNRFTHEYAKKFVQQWDGIKAKG